jgi:hypothetical protein
MLLLIFGHEVSCSAGIEVIAEHGERVSARVIASELTRRRVYTRTGSKHWSAKQALRLRGERD